MSHPKPLGRRVPESDEHILKHPLRLATSVTTVNRTMRLPWWHWLHDQGAEGACVGFGTSMERAVRELHQRVTASITPSTVRLNPWWYWDRAKAVDWWPDTNPGDAEGTSVHAAYDVVRAFGGVRMANSLTLNGYPGLEKVSRLVPSPEFSVQGNVWATSVDQMRTCIARYQPITIGVNWYSGFDQPSRHSDGYYWIEPNAVNTSIRGGHALCVYGASDRRQAFRVKNSWGRGYPLIWMPYTVMARLLNEDGEATVVNDAT